MGIEAVRDIAVIGAVVAGVYIAWSWWIKSDTPDVPGTQYNNYYVPSPDTVYSNHPFSSTPLDPVYDAGWDYMGVMRGNTQDYFNMAPMDYWFGWMKGSVF